jgi:hypothetical protein
LYLRLYCLLWWPEVNLYIRPIWLCVRLAGWLAGWLAMFDRCCKVLCTCMWILILLLIIPADRNMFVAKWHNEPFSKSLWICQLWSYEKIFPQIDVLNWFMLRPGEFIDLTIVIIAWISVLLAASVAEYMDCDEWTVCYQFLLMLMVSCNIYFNGVNAVSKDMSYLSIFHQDMLIFFIIVY